MRLPWPFGRSTAAPADTTPDSPAPVAPEAPSRPVPTGAWASLPPIQRAVGAAPLVTSSVEFFDAVPGVHPLPPIVEPLGHDVTQGAPVGLVGAPVHAVSSLTSHASLVPPPVQRRAEGSSVPAVSEPLAPTAAADAPRSAAAGPVAVSSESVAVDPPTRQLGIVVPAATARPPDRSLTRAEPPSTPGRTERPLAGRRTQVQTSQASAPVAAPPTADAAPTRSRPQPDMAAAARPTARPTGRRAGLGVPLPTAPDTAVPAGAGSLPGLTIARLPASLTTPSPAGDPRPPTPGGPLPPVAAAGGPLGTNPTAGAAPLRTTIQRRINGPRPASAEPETSASDGAEGANLGPTPATTSVSVNRTVSLPVLRVVGQGSPTEGQTDELGRSTTVAASGSTAGRTSGPTARTPASGAPSVSRAAAPDSVAPRAARPQRRPLVGNRPIGPVGPVQREPSTDGGSSAAGSGPSLPPVGSIPSATLQSPLGSSSVETPGTQIWSLADGWGPGASSSADRATVQRQVPRASSSTLDLASAWGQSRPPGTAGNVAVPMTLARPPAPSTASSPESAASPTVARSSMSEGPNVQTVPMTAGSVQGPVFGPAATPVVQRVDSSAPVPPVPNTGSDRSDDELDELARSLFGRIRNHLRNEYIYEREAKGLTFDQS